MAISTPDSNFMTALFGDPAMQAIFSDAPFVQYLLRVEGALARAEGALGVIPPVAAQLVSAACEDLAVDMAALLAGWQRDGVPVSALVKQIRGHVGGTAAAFVHRGATTQDIMDTALVLQMRDAFLILEQRLEALVRGLAALADKYRHTLMAGRTHSQQALPITFGLKAALWCAPLLRDAERLRELRTRVLVVQFGGAAGTLAALGDKGIAVQNALARELGLGVPIVSWHTQRDNLTETANWLSLVTASAAKMAQDIILLTQSEVGEVRESSDTSRGESSTMPQKSNPVVSERVIALARANAALASSMHHAMIQEHERATHGWQMEWLTLPQMFAHTAGALKLAQWLAENLVVDAARMLENVQASNGLMLAEAISLALAEVMPQTQAKELVTVAVPIAVAEKRHLVDLIQERTEAPLDWISLREEANYLGSTDTLIRCVLEQVALRSSGIDSGAGVLVPER